MALGAGALGLAVALLLSGGSPSSQRPLVSTFLFWLVLSFGLALSATPMTLAVALCGASLTAFLIAGGTGCVALVAALDPPVSARFLRCSLWAVFLLFVLGAILSELIVPDSFLASALVRVSVRRPDLAEELPITYDPRFVATEGELIESTSVLTDVLQSLDLRTKWGAKYAHGEALETAEALVVLASHLDIRPVSNSSLIEIGAFGDSGNEAGSIANDTARIYRDYWDRRSETNRERTVKVTMLDDAATSGGQTQRAMGRHYNTVMANLVSGLFVLCGILWAAGLAKKPVQLYYIPAFAIAYLIALGLAFLASALSSDTYGARSLVRVWQTTPNLAPAIGPRRIDTSEAMLRGESDRAVSPAALARAVQLLEASPEFMKHRRDWRGSIEGSEKDRWLRRRLRVGPLNGTFLLQFEASADSSEEAVQVARAAATAYCNLRGAIGGAGSGSNNLEVEMIDASVPSTRSEAKSNPVLAGLQNGFGKVGWFLLGTGIGYLGYLVGRVQGKQPTFLPHAAPEGSSRLFNR